MDWNTDVGSPRGTGSKTFGCAMIFITIIIGVIAAVAVLELL